MVIPVSGNADKFRFTLSNPDGAWLDADVDAEVFKPEVGTWYFSAVIIKPDSVIVFNNDQVVVETEFTRDLSTLDDTQNALGKSFWPDALFTGALSDLRVYKSELTRQQVIDIYNGHTSIQNVNLSKIKAYAANNRIHVTTQSKNASALVSVYDVTGSLVQIKTVSELENVTFRSGVYLLKVNDKNSNYTAKVIVK
jgi:hypothetical protein